MPVQPRNGVIANQQLAYQVQKNHETVFLLSTDDVITLYREYTGRELVADSRTGANYASAVVDMITLARALRELGFTGRAYEKIVNGKRYVIFKGKPAQRTILTGSRYLATNAKVIDMAVGKAAVEHSIRSGARLTIFLTVPIVVVEHLLKDQFLMSELVADIGVSLVKVGIASVVSAIAATAVGTVTTVAVAPFAVAVFVGLLVGYALDRIDVKFGLTSKLAQAIRDIEDATVGEFRRGLWELEKRLRWQIINGVPVGKGIFYP